MSGGTCTTHSSEHIMDLMVISNLIAYDLNSDEYTYYPGSKF